MQIQPHRRNTEKRKLRSACVYEIQQRRGCYPRKVIMERIDGLRYVALFTYGRGVIRAEIPDRSAARREVYLA